MISISGGAGTGKSYLIQKISQWVEFILRQPGDSLDYPKLIRLAFTGAAAHLIGKMEI